MVRSTLGSQIWTTLQIGCSYKNVELSNGQLTLGVYILYILYIDVRLPCQFSDFSSHLVYGYLTLCSVTWRCSTINILAYRNALLCSDQDALWRIPKGCQVEKLPVLI